MAAIPPAMARWLVKEEPTHYGFDDLVRDRRTEWSGIHNALALRHLRSMRVGDEVFYYHTGSERAIVGIARVARAPRPDPRDARGSWSVEVEAVGPLARPVTLAELRGDAVVRDLDLLRISRLSVMPVADAHWRRILARAGAPVSRDPPSPTRRAGARSLRSKARRRARPASASGVAPRRSARRSAPGTGS